VKSFLRLIKFGLYGSALAILGFLLLFVAYGLRGGHDILSGLAHLIEPTPDAVTTNPVLQNVAWQRVSWVADIENRALAESSGLTASNLHEDVFWSINDSGNAPELFAIGMDGADLGTWQIDAPDTVDWESMDSFVLDGTAYLIIGDTGDNFRWRKQLSLLVIAEPTSLIPNQEKLPIAWQVDYRYPEGARDSEALAVDADNNVVYVLSKRRYPAELFRLPLRSEELVVAEKLVELKHLPRPVQAELDEDDSARYRHTPTGMDLAGGRLLVTTYKHGYLYQLGDLQAAPLRVRLPSIGQREALTFARGRDDVAYITRERREGTGVADLFMIELTSDAKPASAQTQAVECASAQ